MTIEYLNNARGQTPLPFQKFFDFIRSQLPRNQGNWKPGWAVGPLAGLMHIWQRCLGGLSDLNQAVFRRHGVIGESPSGDRAIRIA